MAHCWGEDNEIMITDVAHDICSCSVSHVLFPRFKYTSYSAEYAMHLVNNKAVSYK